MSKIYLDANTLLSHSFQLARNIYESDFTPTALLALWRGGTPVGIAIHEGLSYLGVSTKHFALRTTYYDQNNERLKKVEIDNFGTIAQQLTHEDSLLIVDDVFDSGKTIETLLHKITHSPSITTPKAIKIATPFVKPNKNLTSITPDFLLFKTDEWIVFPHELHGLDEHEIYDNKPCARPLIQKIEA